MIRRGMSRLVLLIGPVAIKIPWPRYGAELFLYGLLGNVLESKRWKATHHPQLARVYWCAPLGLLLVMRRYATLVNRCLTPEEIEALPFLGIDNNGDNVAMEHGQLVLIDYGNITWYLIKR